MSVALTAVSSFKTRVDMESVINLWEPVLQKQWNYEYINQYLKSCNVHKAFSLKTGNTLQPVISAINTRLNTSATRVQGLILLQAFLPQCSGEILNQHAVSWTQQCVKVLQTNHSSQVFRLVCDILGEIMEETHHFPEFNKPLGGVITQLIPHLLETAEECTYAGLKCLSTCMRCMPGPCGLQKSQIKKKLHGLLVTVDTSLVAMVAECYSLLPQIGGKGNEGINYKSSWVTLAHQFAGSLHSTLDGLYENINEVQNFVIPEVSLELPAIEESNPMWRIYKLKHQYVILAASLGRILRNPYPVSKKVDVDEILGVVCRTLAVDCKTLSKKNNIESLVLGAVLPDIHTAGLSLLQDLILCCRSSLIPNAGTITKLALQTLKWTYTEKRVYGAERPYGMVRSTAYQVLQLWCRVTHVASSAEMLAEDIISRAFTDIIPDKDAVKLQTLTSEGKKKRKKRKSSHLLEMGEESLQKKVDPLANFKVCSDALQMTSCLLNAVGSLLRPVIHKDLQKTVVTLLLELQQKGQSCPIPYNNAICRQQLYHLLKALVLNSPPKWPPPLQLAVRIFNNAVHDIDLEVADAVREGLNVCETLIHPRVPTLNYPIPLADMTRVLAQEVRKRKIVEDLDREDNSVFTDGTENRETRAEEASDINSCIEEEEGGEGVEDTTSEHSSEGEKTKSSVDDSAQPQVDESNILDKTMSSEIHIRDVEKPETETCAKLDRVSGMSLELGLTSESSGHDIIEVHERNKSVMKETDTELEIQTDYTEQLDSRNHRWCQAESADDTCMEPEMRISGSADNEDSVTLTLGKRRRNDDSSSPDIKRKNAKTAMTETSGAVAVLAADTLIDAEKMLASFVDEGPDEDE